MLRSLDTKLVDMLRSLDSVDIGRLSCHMCVSMTAYHICVSLNHVLMYM